MPADSPASPPFPGTVLKPGVVDVVSINAAQRRLNRLGCGPVEEDGVYGAETQEAVSLFQARSVDFEGRPLQIDGKIGPMTWAALFKAAPLAPQSPSSDTLSGKVLVVAGTEVGVMEVPPGSNRGPKVDEYLKSVGLNPGQGSYPWCAAFVYWCFLEASKALSVSNPAICTAGALDLWNQAGPKRFRRIPCAEASDNPTLVRPAMVFVLGTGPGHGHVGFVEKVTGTILTTIEGNTNDGGSREGIGVFRRVGRRIETINQGFVDYTSRS